MDSVDSPSTSGTPRPGKNSTTDSSEATAAARRAKKREQDRRCQRMLRERTKNRIAYLENLLADVQQQGTSAQLQTLWKERDEAVADRDRLIQALRTINRVVQTSHSQLANAASIEPVGQVGSSSAVQELPTDDDSGFSEATSSSGGGMFPEQHIHAPEQGQNQSGQIVDDGRISAAHTMAEEISNAMWFAGQFEDMSSHGDIFNTASDTATSGAPMSSASLNMPDQRWTALPQMKLDTCFSTGSGACECQSHKTTTGRSLNLWRFANDILTDPLTASWSPEMSAIEDALAEDIPIRAIAESWDAAAQSLGGTLPPSWQRLRQIDETLFPTLPATERLATMMSMHALLTAKADTTMERRARLPDWYIARPSQTIEHAAAADYFPWPGVRERFVFHQHRYCANKFWHIFNRTYKIVWPFEFRDCYTRSIQTGRYNISSGFMDRIKDIRAFTVGEDMFHVWPELRADIPSFNSITMTLTPNWPDIYALTLAAAQQQQQQQHQQNQQNQHHHQQQHHHHHHQQHQHHQHQRQMYHGRQHNAAAGTVVNGRKCIMDSSASTSSSSAAVVASRPRISSAAGIGTVATVHDDDGDDNDNECDATNPINNDNCAGDTPMGGSGDRAVGLGGGFHYAVPTTTAPPPPASSSSVPRSEEQQHLPGQFMGMSSGWAGVSKQ